MPFLDGCHAESVAQDVRRHFAANAGAVGNPRTMRWMVRTLMSRLSLRARYPSMSGWTRVLKLKEPHGA